MPKTAIVTGASTGIGRALTLALAARGHIVIAVARNTERLKILQSQYPENIQIIAADISCENGRNQLLQAVNKKIDYLIHNAAIITPLIPLHDYSENDLRKIMETNLISPILLSNNLLPYLSEGRILNITSVSGQQATAGLSGYCITKAGFDMWTQLQKLELKKYNIHVASVIPGEVDTPVQTILRSTPTCFFPLATEFQKAKHMGTLISAETVALFLVWLLDLPTQHFSIKEAWNIYDEWHHIHWLGDNKLPQPLNKNKLGATSKDAPMTTKKNDPILKEKIEAKLNTNGCRAKL